MDSTPRLISGEVLPMVGNLPPWDDCGRNQSKESTKSSGRYSLEYQVGASFAECAKDVLLAEDIIGDHHYVNHTAVIDGAPRTRRCRRTTTRIWTVSSVH